jgi:hypothetical protein
LLPYSKPTTGSSWLDPFKHERQIHLETILTYMDEIHGGKSVPGVPLRSTPGFSPVAPSALKITASLS